MLFDRVIDHGEEVRKYIMARAIEVTEITTDHRRLREERARDKLIAGIFGNGCHIIHDSAGKPLLVNASGRPSGVALSISHSLSHIAVAWSHDADLKIGIDIEQNGREHRLPALAPRILTTEELALYTPVPHGLLLAWTLKESAFKASALHPVDFRANIMLPPVRETVMAADGSISYHFSDRIVIRVSDYPDFRSENLIVHHARMDADGTMLSMVSDR